MLLYHYGQTIIQNLEAQLAEAENKLALEFCRRYGYGLRIGSDGEILNF